MMSRVKIILIVITLGMIAMSYKLVTWIYIHCNNPLSYIIVTGNRQLTTNYDVQILIEKLGTLGTFITQDINIIQKNIAQLPWIKQVSIRKQWPNALKIHVIEYIPKAYWNDDSIISMEGVVFKIPKHQRYNNYFNNLKIPILCGPANKSQDVLYNYMIFEKILKSSIFQIKSIKMDICFSWQLTLKNDICLKLGRHNVVDRLLYFVKIYPALVQKIYKQNRHIDYIDLRYKSGVAIKWMNETIISEL